MSVSGEVLFNCTYPEDLPDFIFGADDMDFFPNIENIKVSYIFLDRECPSSEKNVFNSFNFLSTDSFACFLVCLLSDFFSKLTFLRTQSECQTV